MSTPTRFFTGAQPSSPQLTTQGTSNVADYVLVSIGKFKDRIAQVDAENRTTITFAGIVSRVVKFAEELVRRGLKRGDVVLLMSKNTIDYCWLMLGIMAAEGVCAPIGPASTPGELEHFVKIMKPKIVIAPELTAENVNVFIEKGNVSTIIAETESTVDFARVTSYKELVARMDTDFGGIIKPSIMFPSTLNDQALLLSSSGTTGLPKAVDLRHRNVISALDNSNQIMRHDGVTLGLMQFCHAYGLCLMLMALCEGSKLVIPPKFNMQSFIETIQSYQITHLPIIPSLLITMGKSNEVKKDALTSVREVITGAGAVTLSQQMMLKKKLKPTAKMFHSYGMTETTFVVTFGEMREDKPGSVGKQIKNIKLKIVNDSGQETETGEIGELFIRGSAVFNGYLNNPEATEETLDSLRWLHSGDLMRKDSDGYYFFVDRRKQLIKFNGYQISPMEIEFLLMNHPQVEDAAVIGVHHETFGEVPCAFVVPKKGYSNEDELVTMVKGELSPYKQLRGGVRFVSNIPKTVTGKIRREILKQAYSDDLVL